MYALFTEFMAGEENVHFTLANMVVKFISL